MNRMNLAKRRPGGYINKQSNKSNQFAHTKSVSHHQRISKFRGCKVTRSQPCVLRPALRCCALCVTASVNRSISDGGISFVLLRAGHLLTVPTISRFAPYQRSNEGHGGIPGGACRGSKHCRCILSHQLCFSSSRANSGFLPKNIVRGKCMQ